MPFVAIEGTDGAGKATQAKLLALALLSRGYACETFAFPAYQETLGGELLAELLGGKRGDFVHADSRLASLPYALDRFQLAPRIRKALAQGKVVIADRFIGSNQIHQGGKIFVDTDRLSELESYLEWLDTLEYQLLGNPKPDVNIYLKVPLEISLDLLQRKRAAKNQGLADGDLDQVERDKEYLANSIAMANWLYSQSVSWRMIECADAGGGMRSREDIHADVWRAIEPLLH